MIAQTSRLTPTRILQPEQEVPPRSRSMLLSKTPAQKSDGPVDRPENPFDQAPVGYFILNEKGRFVDINTPGLTMLGIGGTTLPEKSFSTFIFAEDLDIYYQHRERLLATSRPQNYELRLVRRDGTEFWAMVALTLAVEPSGDLRYHLVITDITEHKKLQEDKIQATVDSRLKKTLKSDSVYRLAGGVAHSFNNMLGVISGYSEMALHHVNKDQPLHADLSKIKQAADRCAELTAQLLSFAGRQGAAPRIVDLNEILAQKIALTRDSLAPTIHLQANPTNTLWPVKIDPNQFDQILNHLLENAVEAIDETGTITIKTENRLINTTLSDSQPWLPAGEYIQLSISDDGCGIGQPILDHIFEPFFTTKKNNSGLGLGLATVHQAVKQNGGHIEVKSTLGQGTIFTLFLPRYRQEASEAPTHKDTGPMGLTRVCTKETILLVDDEPVILEMVARLLDHQGYTIIKANNAEEALVLTEEYADTIDLLLTDVVMPGMNGDDLAQKLLLKYPRMKCLFMSGYAIDVVTGRGVFNDDIHFIQKPFGIDGVLLNINKVLANG